jgi:hypothetical protein
MEKVQTGDAQREAEDAYLLRFTGEIPGSCSVLNTHKKAPRAAMHRRGHRIGERNQLRCTRAYARHAAPDSERHLGPALARSS